MNKKAITNCSSLKVIFGVTGMEQLPKIQL